MRAHNHGRKIDRRVWDAHHGDRAREGAIICGAAGAPVPGLAGNEGIAGVVYGQRVGYIQRGGARVCDLLQAHSQSCQSASLILQDKLELDMASV